MSFQYWSNARAMGKMRVCLMKHKAGEAGWSQPSWEVRHAGKCQPSTPIPRHSV